MKWIRHGDVILEEVDGLEGGLKDVKEVVLAEGEVTGHLHVLKGDLREVFDGEARVVCVNGVAELSHPEHDTINVPEGSYKVRIQREVDLLGEVRQVMD